MSLLQFRSRSIARLDRAGGASVLTISVTILVTLAVIVLVVALLAGGYND